MKTMIITLLIFMTCSEAFAQRNTRYQRHNEVRNKRAKINKMMRRSQMYQRPRRRVVTPYVHNPYIYRNHIRPVWQPIQYYNHFQANFSAHIYAQNWFLRPAVSSFAGYQFTWGNHFYFHAGIAHRYNPVEQCRYELIDSALINTGISPVINFSQGFCNIALDRCLRALSGLNYQAGYNRFLCAERIWRNW